MFLRGYHHNDKQRAKPLPRRIPIPSAQSTTRANPQSRRARHLLILLAPELGRLVDHVHVELLRTLHDRLTVQGGDVVGNLSAVFPVVHHEKVKVGDVVDDELEEAVGEQVPGLLVGPVADVGVGGKTLELAPEAAIDTTGLPPRLLLPRGGGMGTGEVSASVGEMSRRKKPRTLVSVEDGQAAGGEPRGRSTSVSEHASCPAHASGVFGCVRRPHKLSHGRLAPREAARGSVRGLVPHATPLLATVFCRNLDAP